MWLSHMDIPAYSGGCIPTSNIFKRTRRKTSGHHIGKPDNNKGEKNSNTLWSLSEISLCRPSRERSATKKPHMPRGVKISCNCKTCQVKIHTLNSCPRKAISQSFKVRWKCLWNTCPQNREVCKINCMF